MCVEFSIWSTIYRSHFAAWGDWKSLFCSENTKNPTWILIENRLGITSRFCAGFLIVRPKLNDHERKQKRNRIISSDSTIRSRGNKLSWDVKTRRQLPMLEQTTFPGPLKIQLKATFVWDTRGWENYEITIMKIRKNIIFSFNIAGYYKKNALKRIS